MRRVKQIHYKFGLFSSSEELKNIELSGYKLKIHNVSQDTYS